MADDIRIIKFRTVTAIRCDADGDTGENRPVELRINEDLIGAIKEDIMLPKGSKVLNLGGDYWTTFRIKDYRQQIFN